jgi:hypothetical protein
MPQFDPELVQLMRTVLEDVMTKVLLEVSGITTKGADGQTTYGDLITAATDQIHTPYVDADVISGQWCQCRQLVFGHSELLQLFVLPQIVTKVPDKRKRTTDAISEDRHVVAPFGFSVSCLCVYACSGIRRGAPNRRGVVHLTGVLVLPACKRFSE